MLETLVLLLFAAALFVCLGLDISILYALVFGFFLFFSYGLVRRHSVKELLSMAVSGVKTVKNILLTFVLIGIITAVWRASGTISYIVYHAARLCSPKTMVLVTFLLCALISVLTGTSFGTAATMGVICATMSNAMGIPILFTGGAILAGSFFGDRCSPMSTSALLVSTVTKTDLFRNLAVMMKTSLVPLAISCVIYGLMGLGVDSVQDPTGIRTLFADHFVLHPVTLLPAAVIVVLSLCRVPVKITMSVSILCGGLICVLVQHMAPAALLRLAVWGYVPQDPQMAALLSGGGVLSMGKVFCIVCIASTYSGLFHGTGLLDGIHGFLRRLSKRITAYGAVLLTALVSAMISCNQTLCIMLTQQLCGDLVPEPETMASHLENTAVVIAPLIPWSIAGAVPLATVGAPALCVLTASYLYLLPLWNFAVELHKSGRFRTIGNASQKK